MNDDSTGSPDAASQGASGGGSVGAIVTVQGEIRPEQLGPCHVHEHLLIMGGLITIREPGYRLAAEDRAVDELETLLNAGCGALVEMTPIGCGRNPRGLVRLAEATGLQIIATTGLHKSLYYDDLHWMQSYSADQMAGLFVRELRDGMDQLGFNGPFPDWTEARAGVIKVATEYHSATRAQERIFDAAAQAHMATGAPIATHTERGTFALGQADMLMSRGIAPGSLAIGHVDHALDLGILHDLAARGCYLQFDRCHRAELGPDSAVIAAVESLVSAGYGHQLLFGMDIARSEKLTAYGGGPGLAYLLREFMPRLASDSWNPVDQFLIQNPRRFLTWKPSVHSVSQ